MVVDGDAEGLLHDVVADEVAVQVLEDPLRRRRDQLLLMMMMRRRRRRRITQHLDAL